MTAAEEAATQAELLENVIATAQRLIKKAARGGVTITPALIAEKVQKAAATFDEDGPSSVDQSKAVNLLIQRNSHWVGKSTTLKDDENHVEWLTAARKRDWLYWRRYREFLESKLSDTVVEGLNEATDDILGLLEDPKRSDDWDQSGTGGWARPIWQDQQLLRAHLQSGRRRLQNHHRARGHA